MKQRKRDECVYVYIYSDEKGVTTGRPVSDKSPTPTHTHTEERDGDSAGSTRAFRGAESASRKPAQNDYGEDRGEELGSSPAALRPPQNAIPFLQYLSLSFIAQGGRPLPPVTSCLFPVLSDRDTPRFSP